MQKMIGQFTVREMFEERFEWVLRPLSKPIYRYGCPPADVMDGAIFALLQGIDPEVVMLLEARRPEKGGDFAWRYALVRFTSYSVSATHQSPVWAVGTAYSNGPEDPFVVRQFQ